MEISLSKNKMMQFTEGRLRINSINYEAFIERGKKSTEDVEKKGKLKDFG